jgi:dnd system-associated protein 4
MTKPEDVGPDEPGPATHARPRPRPDAELEKSVMQPLLKAGLFRTKYEVLTFAAALGLHFKDSSPLKPGGEGIRLEYFEKEGHDIAIDLVGIMHELSNVEDAKDALLAVSPERLSENVSLFERHAVAGLRRLKKACFESGNTAADGLIRLMDKAIREKPTDADVISEIF